MLVEPNVTAGFVDRDVLGTGLGALGTVNGTAKLVSSASVGIIWTAVSPQTAFGLAAILMTIGTILLSQINKTRQP